MPDIRTLTKDLQEIATTQLNEDPKRIDDDLKHIKDWLSKQPHITSRTDDQFLVSFLRGCKYSLERTKEKLDFYHTLRSTLGEYFQDRDPMKPGVQKILDLGVMIPLPEPDDLGRRVFIVRVGSYDASEVKITEIFKVNFLIMDLMLMKDDYLNVAGVVSIIDLNNATLAHVAQMTPTIVKQSMKCSQLYVHGEDMESLYKIVPRRILPKEYGGEAPSVDEIAKKVKKEVEDFRDWYLEDSKYKTNESKRPGKPKTYEDLFGIEGSFRQLTVD